jgi:hypothetical protein
MLPTVWYLRRLGLDARAFGYPTRRGTLQSRAEALDAFVRGWLGPDAGAPVIGFLTHSMGGLVVRAWLAAAHVDGAQRQRVVMLSPPNRGSQLARLSANSPWFRLAYGDAAAELASDAALQLGDAPSSADVLVLAGGSGARGWNPRIDGDDDGVVAVSEMGMPGIDPTFVGGVHGLLQWTPALLRRAAGFIRTGIDPGNEGEAPGRP